MHLEASRLLHVTSFLHSKAFGNFLPGFPIRISCIFVYSVYKLLEFFPLKWLVFRNNIQNILLYIFRVGGVECTCLTSDYSL
jgi:hypothetical protein